VSARVFIDEPTLVDRLKQSRYVLLGEKHDNPDHHKLQARLLQAITQKGRKPIMVLEMIERDLQKNIDKQINENPKDIDGIAVAVNWEDSRWPDWQHYRPLFKVAVEKELPIVAGSLARERIREIVKNGASVMRQEFVIRYGLDKPLPEEIESALLEHLSAVHCGYMPEKKMRPMMMVQRSRDAFLADRMLAADPSQGAVLIAGAEHARKDRGVPTYLTEQNKGTMNTDPFLFGTMAFIEVSEDMQNPVDYQELYQAKDLPFDYVWFTPRVDDLDHCEQLKKKFAKHGTD
jgi:uncharacterized iron-regulated protein